MGRSLAIPARSIAALARDLAERARSLRASVLEEIHFERGYRAGRARPVIQLYETFERALARQSEAEFADACAQTLTYGLLAARWMTRAKGEPFGAAAVDDLLPRKSPLLTGLLRRLIELRASKRLRRPIEGVIRALGRTDISEVFAKDARDPVIHFYEDFLDAYDPQIRRQRGVYYTPYEVVSYIVRTAHTALQAQLNLPLGLADTTTWEQFAKDRGLSLPEGVRPSAPFVQILDPASGTGTFLLRVIEVTHETMMASYAARGLDQAAARDEWVAYVREHLLPRVHGFELMTTPYVVSHLRLGLALEQTGFVFNENDRLSVFLTNTLELSGDGLTGRAEGRAADEAREAERVKWETPISVIVGNPPYEREPSDGGICHKGGWIRGGFAGARCGSARAPLADYIEPAEADGAGGHLKNIYNLYVYFWRWATWRVFDRHGAPGVVSLVTASSYLRGPGFVGVREEMRRAADTIYVLDLEGDRRGPRISENVFGVTIPVCVGTLIASASPQRRVAARGHYRCVKGPREAKLAACNGGPGAPEPAWTRMPAGWQAPFLAERSASYASWPAVTDIFPWQHSGVQFKRTWPIGETKGVLERRWKALLCSPDRSEALRETGAWTVEKTFTPLFLEEERRPSIASLPMSAPLPRVCRYAFRSFDLRVALADRRLGDRLRAPLWRIASERQVYLTSLLSGVIGRGPAATVAAHVPDLHHFRGSYGGKDVVPLWRDERASQPNLSRSFVAALERALGAAPAPEDTFAYTYAILANPGFVERFEDELQVPGLCLPVTKDRALFERGAALGRDMIRWHSFGERWRTEGDGFKLTGSAKVVRPISKAASKYPERHRYERGSRTLFVGDGAIRPVSAEVWSFAVSGLLVVKSWLDYRMKKGAGKKSSPLDEIRPERWTDDLTRELCELLWVLEWTLSRYPTLDAWLGEVLASDLLTASEIPEPDEAERKAPRTESQGNETDD